MPFRIEIDKRRGRVVTEYYGTLRRSCTVEATQAYLEHPDFRPWFDAIVDATGVEGFDMNTGEVLDAGRASPYEPGSRLALVAASELGYGLARAFQMTVEGKGRVARVFIDRAAAEAWLDEARGRGVVGE